MTENKHYIEGMSILRLDRFMHNRVNNKASHLSPASMEIYNDIFQLFARIKPTGSNHYRQVWFKVPRGTYTDYGFANDKEACEYFEIDSPSKLKDTFEEWFPRSEYWLGIESVSDNGFRMLRIGEFTITIDSDCRHDEDWREHNYSELLAWVKKGLEETIAECEAGSYNDRIERELPYTLRYGVIRRRELWDHHPEYRQHQLKNLTEEEIQDIIELLKKNMDSSIPTERIKDMTFRQYFEYAAIAFKAAGFTVEGSTPFSLFACYGEDFGGRILQNVDHDSAENFLKFYNGEWRAGGHPWGFMRGSSRSRIMLYPKLDEGGYYFVFSGNPNWSIYEIVKMYSALYAAGLPILFCRPQETLSYLLEEDLVGFVTENDLRVYCQLAFKEHINDFYYFCPEEDEAIKSRINWQPVRKVYLLDSKRDAVTTEAVGYVRYEKSEDRYSTKTNETAKRISQYCHQKGYTLMDMYRDLGDGHEKDRAEIEYILSHLDIHLFDVLVVDTVKDISLDGDFLVDFIRTLNEHGRKVYEVRRDMEITIEVLVVSILSKRGSKIESRVIVDSVEDLRNSCGLHRLHQSANSLRNSSFSSSQEQ